jgi:23S rRNA (adenine1618-N6)-methyltransferase
MPAEITPQAEEKEILHPRNLHRERYDFEKLIRNTPELRGFVKLNKYDVESSVFCDPKAVVMLNQALLKLYYKIKHWEIPEGYLCPPIPGRADYIHYLADLLANSNDGVIPTGDSVKALDIGTGANLIYPLIGNSVYGWNFAASDIDPLAIRSANDIIAANAQLKGKIETRQQTNKADIFKRVIKPGETFDVTMCNPPFHASWQEAQAVTVKKWQKLNNNRSAKTLLNFGGKNNELWCTGGEAAFIRKMADESALFGKQVLWFSTLVSKKETLEGVYKALEWVKAFEVRTINMAQGQKVSRIVAWTFLNEAEQAVWKKLHWVKK